MKNLPLIVGIALPIAFIAILVGVLYIPASMLHPQYDFLYTLETSYSNGGPYRNEYMVENKKLATRPLPPPYANQEYRNDIPELYRYEVKTNTSHIIDRATANTYTLDAGPSSPDGFSVAYQYSNSGIFELFGGGGNNSGYYISKGGAGKPLPALASPNSWSGSMKVVGWIIDK